MTRNHDLHPDDTEARIRLRNQLRNLRRSTGVTVHALAEACATTPAAIYLYEQRGHNPLCASVQRHARHLGRRLQLHPVFDPALPDHPDAATFTALADATTNLDLAARHEQAALMANLVAYRRWYGLTARDLADRLNVVRGSGSVSAIESGTKPAHLSTYQRYARALGGRLDLHLQPIDQQ